MLDRGACTFFGLHPTCITLHGTDTAFAAFTHSSNKTRGGQDAQVDWTKIYLNPFLKSWHCPVVEASGLVRLRPYTKLTKELFLDPPSVVAPRCFAHTMNWCLALTLKDTVHGDWGALCCACEISYGVIVSAMRLCSCDYIWLVVEEGTVPNIKDRANINVWIDSM